MNDENAILAYYQGISDGSIVVGKWIRLLSEMILDGIEDHTWFYDQRKASNVIRFIERFCHHYKGRMAPQRIRLELFQRAALSCMFGIVDGYIRISSLLRELITRVDYANSMVTEPASSP